MFLDELDRKARGFADRIDNKLTPVAKKFDAIMMLQAKSDKAKKNSEVQGGRGAKYWIQALLISTAIGTLSQGFFGTNSFFGNATFLIYIAFVCARGKQQTKKDFTARFYISMFAVVGLYFLLRWLENQDSSFQYFSSINLIERPELIFDPKWWAAYAPGNLVLQAPFYAVAILFQKPLESVIAKNSTVS
ncbi:MAG: hypothetical protein HYT79_07300 [Elusimicrobia bacterium]|nr:hypothetical protein [Elusimicrobiota bacterium]